MGERFESVTAAEIMRNFGYWQQKALLKPLAITHHGRARVMLISTESYEDLTGQGEIAPIGTHLDDLRANMAEGMTIIDRDFILRDVNNTALAWMGLSREQAVGQPLGGPGNWQINPLHRSMLSRVMRTGEALTYDFVSAGHEGHTLHVRSFPYGDMVGSLYADVTEYMNLHVAHRIREAAIAGLERLDVVGMAELDAESRIVSASAPFARMVGLGQGGLAGRAFADLCRAEDCVAVAKAIAGTLRDQTVRLLEIGLIHPTAGVGRYRLSIAPLDYEGAPRRVTIAVTAADPKGRN